MNADKPAKFNETEEKRQQEAQHPNRTPKAASLAIDLQELREDIIFDKHSTIQGG